MCISIFNNEQKILALRCPLLEGITTGCLLKISFQIQSFYKVFSKLIFKKNQCFIKRISPTKTGGWVRITTFEFKNKFQGKVLP